MFGLFLNLALSAVAADGCACVAPDGYTSHAVAATVRAGETFRTRLDRETSFVLAPTEFGWVVEVRQTGRVGNLAALTPPWHFVPNPRHLEGWHFRNASNTGPNDGSVNAPQTYREFYFSPDTSQKYEGSTTPAATVAEVRAFGRGEITLTDYALTPVAEAQRAAFTRLSFAACLIWRDED